MTTIDRRTQYLIAKALVLAEEQLRKVTGVLQENSDLEDMQALMETPELMSMVMAVKMQETYKALHSFNVAQEERKNG